jgi:hypothetical protein
MEGDPRHFESFISRLGFQVHREDSHGVRLVWHSTRYPGLLCLGLSLALLFLSVPVLQAILIQGTDSTAMSLWYFPAMNLILFCVALFLLSLNRTTVIDQRSKRVLLSKRSVLRRRDLAVVFGEIAALRVGTDMVYSGPAVAGTNPSPTAKEKTTHHLRTVIYTDFLLPSILLWRMATPES